ncbi:hypothetical protein CKAN_01503400 [Cinnamomum micranthum f. kanehirae]|uniref:Uncharacterized protein n=1 Tax=Cinnamomum micranthum f. kanehirae TaxID=337451 RepID=A0A3S3NTE1_9MAGN|nr:hypothetical protein CKAN_01503400 [Cinnamomum micranthum f. kanehirae]
MEMVFSRFQRDLQSVTPSKIPSGLLLPQSWQRSCFFFFDRRQQRSCFLFFFTISLQYEDLLSLDERTVALQQIYRSSPLFFFSDQPFDMSLMFLQQDSCAEIWIQEEEEGEWRI